MPAIAQIINAISRRIVPKTGESVFTNDLADILKSLARQLFIGLNTTNITALRAIPVSEAADGLNVTVGGYYTSGDGGGGQFYYSASSSATDNGGTVIAPNSGTGRWLRVYQGAINVKWFGAKGDGSTDDTTALQAALNTLIASVYIPPGLFIATSLTLNSSQTIQGAGSKVSTIKRAPSSGSNNFITGSTITGACIFDLTIDGNRSNNTLGCNCISLSSSNRTCIRRCEITGGKVNAGYGAGISINSGTNQANSTIDEVTSCYIHDNDDAGCLVTKEWFVKVSDNLFYSNKSGLNVINFAFPPTVDVQDYFSVCGNYCVSNTTAGISFYGFTTGGNSSSPIEGATLPPQVGCVISNNTCYLNGQYGIAFQGAGATVSNNVCKRNGTTTNDGGMLFNAWNSTCTANVLDDNALYGIDAGGSRNCTFSGNVIRYQGNTSGLGANGLNMGATVGCTVVANTFENNGGSGQSSLYAPGWEFGAGTYFDQLGSGIVISGNTFTLNSGAIGINVQNGFDNVTVIGNTFIGASANCACILNGGNGSTFNVIERDNNDLSNGFAPVIASASTLVIPDIGNVFYVTGTTTINTIRTNTQNQYNQKVRFVQITSVGSAYVPGSPPTVSFSGGGGTGAAGTALVTNSGHLIGVAITNTGTGYTSAPTVSFSGGGGGSGAAGTAQVGSANCQTKIANFFFFAASPVATGSGIFLNGGTTYTPGVGGGSTLTLRNYNGSWYQTAVSTN